MSSDSLRSRIRIQDPGSKLFCAIEIMSSDHPGLGSGILDWEPWWGSWIKINCVAPNIRSCHPTACSANHILPPVWFDQSVGDKIKKFNFLHILITHASYFSAFVKSHSVELAWRSVGADLKLIQGATRSTIQPSTSSSSRGFEGSSNSDSLLVQWRLASNQLTSDWWVSSSCPPALDQTRNP